MKTAKLLICAMALMGCVACDEGTEPSYTDEYGQQAYNDMKGTYEGNIMVNNLPQKLSVTIGNDFTVRPLPAAPMLERIFTAEGELDKALRSAQNITFKAPTDKMALTGVTSLLTMEPTDLQFSVTVDDKSYEVTALIESSVYVNLGTHELSMNMDVVNLYCDGKSYDVKTNRINYFVDIARKVATN